MQGTGVNNQTHGTNYLKQFQRPGVNYEDIQELKEAFDLIDLDGDGTIDIKEIQDVMNEIGFQTKSSTLLWVMQNIDQNSDNSIDFEEFVLLMTSRVSDKDNRVDIKKIFDLFDQDGKGSITAADLKKICYQLGEVLEDSEIQEMIQRADTNENGSVDSNEFYNLVTRNSYK